MQTLVQYEYLDRDSILKGVCETIVEESPVLRALPFKPYEGNSYKYNIELTLPTVDWLGVGQQITESTGTQEQRSTDIFRLGGDADTDKGQKAFNATQDPEAVDIAAKAKAMARTFEQVFVRGQTSTLSSTKQFKGLMRIIAEFESSSTTDLDGATNQNSQVIAETSGTSGALTMAKMDQLVDQIRPGAPQMFLMSRLARRKLNVLSRASGSGGVYIDDAELFGIKMEHYDRVPVMISDYVPDNLPNMSSSVTTISTWNPDTTRAADLDNTIIFAMKFGEKEVCGLQVGEMRREHFDKLEDYDAVRNRFIWYVGLFCPSKYALACLTGVNPDT